MVSAARQSAGLLLETKRKVDKWEAWCTAKTEVANEKSYRELCARLGIKGELIGIE